MNCRRFPVRRRIAHLGWGALSGLSAALGPVVRVALVASGSLSAPDREAIQRAAGRGFTTTVQPPARVTRADLEALRAETAAAGVEALIGVGGGRIMDAAKALARPGGPRLVLLPTTLSGSEHTANTSWWDADRKVVARVGFADAVCADPGLLVARRDVLVPGALHAVAHVLATVEAVACCEVPATVAALALPDLARALASDSVDKPARLRFTRGAWNAAVGFALTGPRIGAHHVLVHQLARPGEHAAFSARLVCATLARSELHQQSLEWLTPRAGREVIADLLAIAAVCDEEWAGEPVTVSTTLDGVPEAMQGRAASMLSVLARS